ncbi:MAG: hypothetical protein WC150_10445 [Bacteroidia bacterium]
MESKIVGQLKANEIDGEYFESEPFEIPYFDNKKLAIGFVEARHQTYLESADKVLENFLKLNSKDRINDSGLVYKYYNETLKSGYTKALNIKTSSEIWNHLIANEIIIQWDENGDLYLCVSCGCDWEIEHGLQLVFKNGHTLVRASGHDGHFTD